MYSVQKYHNPILSDTNLCLQDFNTNFDLVKFDMKLCDFCILIAFIFLVSTAKSDTTKKTLVLHDNSDIQSTHSIFFKSLEG